MCFSVYRSKRCWSCVEPFRQSRFIACRRYSFLCVIYLMFSMKNKIVLINAMCTKIITSKVEGKIMTDLCYDEGEKPIPTVHLGAACYF